MKTDSKDSNLKNVRLVRMLLKVKLKHIIVQKTGKFCKNLFSRKVHSLLDTVTWGVFFLKQYSLIKPLKSYILFVTYKQLECKFFNNIA